MSELFQPSEASKDADIPEVYEACEPIGQEDYSDNQFSRRSLLRGFGAAAGATILGSALVGCDRAGDYSEPYRRYIQENSKSIPDQTYRRRSLAEWAADAETADAATRPYAQRLYEQVASRYDGALYIAREDQAGQERWHRAMASDRGPQRFIEWNAGRLTIGAQTTVKTPENEPNRVVLSMTYLVPPFSSGKRYLRDALDGDAKLAAVDYLNMSKQGGVAIYREGLSVNGDVELVVPKGVDETVIDVSQATRIALDETRAAAARLGLA